MSLGIIAVLAGIFLFEDSLGAVNLETMEAQGDLWSARAEPLYRKAAEAWQQVETYALRARDAAGQQRARRQRHAILIALRDPRALRQRVLSTRLQEVWPSPVALPAPGTVTPGTAPPTEKQLIELVRFFTKAGRAYFKSPDREPRDMPVLFEALALSHRLHADYYQVKGDAEYLKALVLLETATSREPSRDLKRIELLAKLRHYDRAYRVYREANIDDSVLEKKERHRFLNMVRDLALLHSQSQLVLDLNRRIKALNLGRGEENPPPLSPLRDFVSGSTADLVRTAATLTAVLSTCQLAPRERALAGYLRATATLEAGELAMSIELFDTVALADCEEPWLKARLLARSAEAHERLGDYEGALASYQEARAQLDGMKGAESLLARVSLNTAGVLLRLGNIEGARQLAIEVIESRGAVDNTIRARIVLGDILYFTPAESTERERELLNDALAAYQLAEKELAASRQALKTAASELEAQVQIHLGNVAERLARLETDPKTVEAQRLRAVTHADRALKTASGAAAGSQHLGRLAAIAAANLGELYLELGQLEASRRFSEWALARAEALGAFETSWRAHWYLGRLADRQQQPAVATSRYERAASIVESHRSRILDAELKVGYMSTKQRFFESMMRRSFESKKYVEAFNIAEKARSRAFIESLGLRFLLFAADRDRQIYRDYINLLSRAEQVRESRGRFFGLSHRSRDGYEDLRRKIENLRQVVRSNTQVSPVVRALVEGAATDLVSVQRGLGVGEVLFEYFSTGSSLVAFQITDTDFRAVDLGIHPRLLSSRVSEFLKSNADNASLAAELYSLLIAPLQSDVHSGAVRSVTIVPWGILHRLPFEALIRGAGGKAASSSGGRYLIEDWELAYLPSASVIRYVQKDAPGSVRPSRLVALVDPDTDYDNNGEPDFPKLLHAREEVAAIASMFKEKVILEGPAALEEACVRMTGAAEVLHLACHGQFFPSRPLESTLYLSRGNDADGRLRAAEVFGIDFRRSRLITLSGCETGRIDVGPGDDPVGLGTAFLHSGARALLVSLWKVEDEATSTLMENFYREWLADGQGNRARALRQAKLKMIRQGTFTNPRQWAAFVLIGLR